MRVAQRQVQLDAVRGIAILLAMGWHFNRGADSSPLSLLLYPGRTFGWAGVDLFFVLSGFLVGGLVLREMSLTGSFNTKRFFIRRALRLWPVLYLFVLARMFLDSGPWSQYVPQILFHVQNYFRTPVSHLWSLAVEEHFYLCAGLLIPLLTGKKNAPRYLLIGLLVLIGLATAARIFAALSGVSPVALQWQTQFRVDSLSIGVLLAVLDVHYPAVFLRIKRAWPALVLLFVLGVAILVASASDVARWRAIFGFPAAAVASAALVLLVHQRPVASPLRGVTNLLAWLGLYSYSLYIWHISAGRKGSALVTRWFGDGAPELRILASYAAAILVAFVVTRLIERPVMLIRDRIFTEPKGVNEPPLPPGDHTPNFTGEPPAPASLGAPVSLPTSAPR